MILNRLLKNWKKLKPWADRQQIQAFRLYDRDIPEYPFLVDLYGEYLVVYDKSDALKDKDKNHLPLLLEALPEVTGVPLGRIVVKKRQRQEGKDQYEKLENRNQVVLVKEGPAQFEVNLFDYLDTGLFLDHRFLRHRIYKDIMSDVQQGKAIRALNLFCYTGSVSVFMALAGAHVTSVDMSGPYLDWAQRNFEHNQIDGAWHVFIQKNAIEYLSRPSEEKFDLIFLDPPTFSNSKRMTESFEVGRDQEFIVTKSMEKLSREGVLYFSNNKRDFRLSENLKNQFLVKDISMASIPIDFHDKKIHCAFEIRHP